jgi:hypothetical protein
MMRKVGLVNAFGILWFLLTPLAVYEDYTLAGLLGIDIKYYYLGLYLFSNLVILLVVLANLDWGFREPPKPRERGGAAEP